MLKSSGSVRKLALPRVVSFDAFGTIYTPKEPVSTQYLKIAQKYIKDIQQVSEQDVISAIMDARVQFPNYGKAVGISQKQWWHEVIRKVFSNQTIETTSEKYDDEAMVDEIFHHFNSSDAYHEYRDIRPFLESLKSKGVILVVSSNSDERLKEVLKSLKLDTYFQEIYLSYDLNCSKPDPLFFSKVIQDLSNKLNMEPNALKNSMWHCGDDYKKDFRNALDNGLKSIYVDRLYESGSISQTNPVKIVEENRAIITNDLSHINELF